MKEENMQSIKRILIRNVHTIFLLVILLLTIILCNCYPFFLIEPYSKHILYPNAYAAKLGLIINGLVIIIVGLTPYLYTILSLRDSWNRFDRKAFIIFGIFILWTMVPGLIVISALLLYVIPCESLDLVGGYSVYYGYLSTTVLGLIHLFIDPLVFILIIMFLAKKYKGLFGSKSRIFIYIFLYWFIVSVVITTFVSAVGAIIDYILGVISPTAPSIYLRGWHPKAVENLVEIAKSEGLTAANAYRSSTALPTWGTLISVMIMSVLIARTTRWILGKLGIKIEIISQD
ncbi:MAG: hypothetical protein DRO40_03205 [Thermoprotei archaeon]|nr:MAG: hypothetical protein DRO40_03205 [Thermoprotei archaeon]